MSMNKFVLYLLLIFNGLIIFSGKNSFFLLDFIPLLIYMIRIKEKNNLRFILGLSLFVAITGIFSFDIVFPIFYCLLIYFTFLLFGYISGYNPHFKRAVMLFLIAGIVVVKGLYIFMIYGGTFFSALPAFAVNIILNGLILVFGERYVTINN